MLNLWQKYAFNSEKCLSSGPIYRTFHLGFYFFTFKFYFFLLGLLKLAGILKLNLYFCRINNETEL